MIDLCPVKRAGTPDEVGAVGTLLMGPEGPFLTGSDFLMDGGRHGLVFLLIVGGLPVGAHTDIADGHLWPPSMETVYPK